MKRNTTRQCFIGCDLGDKKTTVCQLDEAGRVVRRSEVETGRAPLQRYFREMPPSQVVMEVGTHSPWVAALVTAAGHEAVVANPRDFKLLTQSRKKSDVNDAELLARAARADLQLLQPVKHRSEETRAELALLRARSLLVKMRTALVTHVRGVLKSFGVKCPSCAAEKFHEKAGALVPEELKPALRPLLMQLQSISAQVDAYDEAVEKLAEKYQPEMKRLTSIPRVGTLTALTFRLVIEDPKRFKKSRDVGAYVGLCPAKRQSGERDPRLGISKAGDEMLRSLLVQCAHQTLFKRAPDTTLARSGHHLLKRGKARNHAATAVARKLASLMHLLWVKQKTFEAFPHS